MAPTLLPWLKEQRLPVKLSRSLLETLAEHVAAEYERLRAARDSHHPGRRMRERERIAEWLANTPEGRALSAMPRYQSANWTYLESERQNMARDAYYRAHPNRPQPGRPAGYLTDRGLQDLALALVVERLVSAGLVANGAAPAAVPPPVVPQRRRAAAVR